MTQMVSHMTYIWEILVPSVDSSIVEEFNLGDNEELTNPLHWDFINLK